MSDWQSGDLAVCMDDGPCPYYGPHPAIAKGRIYTVSEVLPRNGLRLAGIHSHSPSGGFTTRWFRKIRPDEHEACEPEFVTLIKRSKPKVDAPEHLIDMQLERLAWLERDAAKVRRWREEDERNGQPWDGDVA